MEKITERKIGVYEISLEELLNFDNHAFGKDNSPIEIIRKAVEGA